MNNIKLIMEKFVYLNAKKNILLNNLSKWIF